MAYDIYVHPLVTEYLSRPEVISDDARQRLTRALVENLAEHGDEIRRRNGPIRPGSPLFWYDHILNDNGRWRHFWFAVSDARAVVGVLLVGYVERRP